MNTTPGAQTLTAQYLKEIIAFNTAHNIVGRRSPQDILNLDINDSQTILEHTKDRKHVLDIGSGAGLPGIIIAIHQPQTYVVMSEKNKKKAYFIKKTIKSLGLKNAEIVDYAITSKITDLGPFDAITARALAETKKIINMSEQLLTDTGIFLLMKGKKERILDEVNGLDINQYSYTIHTKTLDEMQRHILEIHKQ